ncbi:ABC transporter substrate-binding protein [Cellulomonas marina]|uniref:Raffinose/stachyose/melibiose transport system substrate-binding protein n=1 Tax=Cellulomonas marina TaxID=988821 RepID=A0A1I0WQ08_9CELL|nr:extracellular solute-binding protein [Cellulomonas marina]GIG27793.1 carbohydrate-binding protein [Cellulomonas marina]SFA90624.1 raffinose/stachyose/melibiose transport system substrate-binding protein [Cellulomonas marina]
MTRPPRPRRRGARRRALVVGTLTASLVALAGCSGAGDGRTTLTFFQFKGEAVAQFEALARQFEAENPDVRVVVQNVPDPETALRTRLVKDDVPDVLTLNGNGTYGELASAGIFADFAGTEVLDRVNPAYVEVVEALGASEPGAVNGVPFAANASGVLYNEELFAQQGVEVPTTWDELLAAAETFEAAGITPFYGMLGDAWTAQSPLAPLTAQDAPEDFFERRFADETTFAEGWRSASEKLATLYDYTQANAGAVGYQDGTRAFAEGQSAMLLLGSYAVPQIRSFEPAFTVGSFALPATDDPERTTLVSGVDVLVTVGADAEHPEEAQRFVDFLVQPDVIADYAAEQVAIPTLEGSSNPDPALAGVQEYIDEGRIVGFTDHQFIPAIPLPNLLQEYLLDRDLDGFLRGLDDSWDQVASRRTWGLGAVQG